MGEGRREGAEGREREGLAVEVVEGVLVGRGGV